MSPSFPHATGMLIVRWMKRRSQAVLPLTANIADSEAHVGPFESETFREFVELSSPFLRLSTAAPQDTAPNLEHPFKWSNSQITQISSLYVAGCAVANNATLLLELFKACDGVKYMAGGKILHEEVVNKACKMSVRLKGVIDRVLASRGQDLRGLQRSFTEMPINVAGCSWDGAQVQICKEIFGKEAFVDPEDEDADFLHEEVLKFFKWAMSITHARYKKQWRRESELASSSSTKVKSLSEVASSKEATSSSQAQKTFCTEEKPSTSQISTSTPAPTPTPTPQPNFITPEPLFDPVPVLEDNLEPEIIEIKPTPEPLANPVPVIDANLEPEIVEIKPTPDVRFAPTGHPQDEERLREAVLALAAPDMDAHSVVLIDRYLRRYFALRAGRRPSALQMDVARTLLANPRVDEELRVVLRSFYNVLWT